MLDPTTMKPGEEFAVIVDSSAKSGDDTVIVNMGGGVFPEKYNIHIPIPKAKLNPGQLAVFALESVDECPSCTRDDHLILRCSLVGDLEEEEESDGEQ